eukprot:9265662-Pyramimonas_sp.AAC.1
MQLEAASHQLEMDQLKFELGSTDRVRLNQSINQSINQLKFELVSSERVRLRPTLSGIRAQRGHHTSPCTTP